MPSFDVVFTDAGGRDFWVPVHADNHREAIELAIYHGRINLNYRQVRAALTGSTEDETEVDLKEVEDG